jgi:hypothetical protein
MRSADKIHGSLYTLSLAVVRGRVSRKAIICDSYGEDPMPGKKPLTALQIAEKLEQEHNLSVRALDMASGHAPGSSRHRQFLIKHEHHTKKFDDLIASLKLILKGA